MSVRVQRVITFTIEDALKALRDKYRTFPDPKEDIYSLECGCETFYPNSFDKLVTITTYNVDMRKNDGRAKHKG